VTSFHSKGLGRPLCACAALATLLWIPAASLGQDQTSAQDQSSGQTTTNPDNSAKNKNHSKTAEQQTENTSDRMITKNIRQSLMADKSLSTYAHNVKIITQDGVVTLKGPVHSEDEKSSIGSKAAEVVGSPDKVHNQLAVKQ
jgi:hyperosmotically inducible protein